MITDKLKSILENNRLKNRLFLRNLLKEPLQDYVLNFIYNDPKYKALTFTGGTCLRKIYGLPRLSEDLDFDFIGSFKIENFAQNLRNYFISKLQYKDLTVRVSGGKQTLFLKFPILEELGLYKNTGDSPILFLRCDLNKEKIGGFVTEVNSITSLDFTFFAKSYDLSTLFANKIMAFLERSFFKGKEQTVPFKGRDLFDLVWFLEKSKKTNGEFMPNWERLNKGLKTNNPNKIADLIVQKAEKIDKKDVTADLLPFIESTQTLENFAENFLSIIKQNIKQALPK